MATSKLATTVLHYDEDECFSITIAQLVLLCKLRSVNDACTTDSNHLQLSRRHQDAVTGPVAPHYS